MKKIGSAIAGYLRVTDKWLLLFWLSASVLSAVFLSGIVQSELLPSGTTIVRTQLIAVGLGLLAALVIALIDYHLLLRLWKLYLPVCVVLVFLTLTGLGIERGGNTAWIGIPVGSFSISFQPSELLKVSFIMTLALHISKVREHINRIPHLLLLCLHGGAHVLLVELITDDTGSAVVFAFVFLAMLFCAGIQWRYIILAVAAAIPMGWFYWERLISDDQKMRFLVLLSEDQKMRYGILLDPDLIEKYIWQQDQALMAFVSGGAQGTGIFSGQHVYVAEAYNDFILSFIGESTGFVGCLGVLVLLMIILFKVLFNSFFAKDDAGKLICVGVFAMIFVQAAINIGMNIGIMPVIGVTLPLFSSGGSSVLSMYLCLGLLLSVYSHSRAEKIFK